MREPFLVSLGVFSHVLVRMLYLICHIVLGRSAGGDQVVDVARGADGNR